MLTHRVADQPPAEAGFRFVADLDTALAQAAEAAGDGDVGVGGGADVLRQALKGSGSASGQRSPG